MRPIKRFTGDTPPLLKLGEFATNGFNVYIGTGDDSYKMIQAVLDLQKEQDICGFHLKDAKLLIPAGTPFSRLQELFDTLPKVLVSNKYQSNVLYLTLEEGEYVNDLNAWLQIRNFNYNIIFVPLHRSYGCRYDRPIVMDMTHSIEVYGSYVRFEEILFKYDGLGGNGAMYGYDSNIDMHFCSFDARRDIGCVVAGHHTEVHIKDCYFKSFAPNTGAIAQQVSYGGSLFVRNCVSDAINNPRYAANSINNGAVYIDGVEELGISERSPVIGAGIEIFGSLHTSDVIEEI